MGVVVTTAAIRRAKLRSASKCHLQQIKRSFLHAGYLSCRLTNGVKTLKGDPENGHENNLCEYMSACMYAALFI